LFSSFAGYGKVGYVFVLSHNVLSSIWNGYDRFDRRFRIYEISDFGETIRTYKRLASEEVVDEMVLAGRGSPEPYAW
jgi:hypothetical protein